VLLNLSRQWREVKGLPTGLPQALSDYQGGCDVNRTLMLKAAAGALFCLMAAALAVDKAQAQAAVGSTPASYGVTPNGAVQYSIPIRATEGIGNLTPRLAISYVGPGQRSILGVGFALNGISYITPCRKTIAQDLNAAPVTLTSADRFCLDGSRLRAVAGSGTYGASNTKYRTELDQMVRATSLESSSGIPGWFKVEMPNGLEYEYGHTDDSRLRASALSYAPPQFWAVNRIKDENGNSIEFFYDTDHGLRRFRPNYILYTMRGSSASYRVNFVYQSATQPEPLLEYTPSTVGGAAHQEDKLLDRIDLLHEGSAYLRYKFAYQNGAGANKRLQSVTECAVASGAETCLPATQFTWQSATSGHQSETQSNMSLFAPKLLDINGDGVDDIVGYSGSTWRYSLGSASGGYGPVINTGVAVVNAWKARSIEWNGDGRRDFMIDWSDGKFRVLIGTENGLSTSPVAAGPGTGVSSNLNNQSMAIADVNGDGRDDVITMTWDMYVQLVVRYNSATGLGSPTVAYQDYQVRALANGFAEGEGSSANRVPDFNGDSRSDLLIYGCVWEPDIYPSGECVATGWFQFVSTGTSYSNYGFLPYATYGAGMRFADVNGDGLTEVIYPAQTPGKWYTAFGQGDSYLQEVPGPSFSGYSYFLTLIGDYDADGIDDLYAAHSSSGTWHVFRGSSTGLTLSPIATGISTNCPSWMVLEATGDDLTDLGCHNSSNGTWKTFAHSGVPGERLTSAVDGLGNQVAFSYLPMTNSTVYAKGTGAVFPNRDYRGTAPLVHTMQISPAGGTSYTLTHKYADARVHAQGRSFLGMGRREITDSRNGMFIAETYRQDFPYVGSPATVTVKQSANGSTIQSTTHSYSNHLLDSTAGSQRYLPYRSQTVTSAYEVGGVKNGNLISEITETHTVNTYGNSTFIAIDARDKDSGSPEFNSVYRTEITASYMENETNWCIGPPLTRSEKRILPGGANETRATAWEVAAAECRITRETVEPGAGSALSLVTDIGYDSCGNVNSVSSYPAGQQSLARTTGINYGTRCQRPEIVTNPENHSSIIAYDWTLAVPTTLTDPNGVVTTQEFDGFGRLRQRNNPDLTDVFISLTACNSDNSWCGKDSTVRVKVSQAMRNSSDVTIRTDAQFLDGFGRARWVQSDSLESGPAIVETAYDAFGRPSAQSQPRFIGGTVYPTTYTRDLIGRVTQINAPISESQTSGRITGLAYEGRDLKVTDPKGNATTRRSNVIGQLRAVIDPSPGGTTSYAYKPFGELASIADAAAVPNVTSWTYDIRGFVTGTADPDSGTWTYESNAFGETERIRDAKTAYPNWTTQFTFDKLGRPKTRLDVPESLTTTWNWGTSAASKNIGRLASIAMSAGGYAEYYAYDSLGRLSQQQVNADGGSYYVNLAYAPATGLLERIKYPISTGGEAGRFEVEHQYANGLLKRVRQYGGGPVFWEAVSTDAWGHYQDESFGNGVQTFTDFDQASGLMESRYGEKGTTVLIHSLVNWDLNGNLKQRQDLKLSPNVTEEFFYDNLNRFDYSTRKLGAGSPATNADVTLDAIGNISWKLGVGNYAYHATQKRAVVSAGSNSYGYDANGNMTSRNGANIGYTSYNLPTVINAPGNYSSTLSYGAFRNRFKQVAVGPQGTETTIYVAGLLEKVTNGSGTHYRHYIAGGKSTAAIHSRTVGGSNATFYLHRDHLGSPELITDASGNVLVRPSFAAYGERRDGSDWDGPPSSGDLNTLAGITRRGFTGHEHLDSVGLIHMNGRVYEPIAGRFLSRDPFIDGFASSQGMNGYAYVHNAPLTFVDPSGFNCEPPPGMSDEEAGAYMSRCSAEFESGGYGILGQNERWCAAMDLGCQQLVLQQRIEEQIYTRTIFNDMLTTRVGAPIVGDGILVLGSRTGESDQLSWMRGSASLAGRVDGMVSATLPDGSRGYLQTSITDSTAGPSIGPSPIRVSSRASGGDALVGLVATAGVAHSMIELSRSIESIDGRSALRVLGRVGPGLAVASAVLSWRQGDYLDAVVTGGLGIGGGVAIFLGSAPVAGAIGVISIGYVLGQIALGDGGP